MRNQFSFVIRGDGLVPETMPAGRLAELIVKLEQIFAAFAAFDAIQLSGPVLSLRDISSGSELLHVSIPSELAHIPTILEDAVFRADYERLPHQAYSPLYELGKMAAKENWQMGFQLENTESPRAYISAQNPIPEPRSTQIEDIDVVVGVCIQVGGVTPRIDIKPINKDRTIHILANAEIARVMARRLYEVVAIECAVTYDAFSRKFINYKAIRLLPFNPSAALNALDQLKELSKGVWDGIDPVEYVRDLRGKEAK